jgi:GTP cyclohydrolase FolE2
MNYQSANTITTEENTVIYTNTYFKAETSITLKPGFAVRSYAEFKASIAPCPSSMTFAEAETQIIKQPLAIKTPIIEKNNLKVYPNPFQQRAMINYQLKEAGNVSIYLFDIAGKMLKQLAQTHQEKGDYQLTLDADYLQSGLYFIHANLNGTLQTEKIYLIKGDRN